MPDPIELDAQTAYARWAATYDDGNPATRQARDLLVRWLPDPAGLDVLELGCGTGGNLSLLRAARSLTGLDLTPQMLDRARAAIPEAVLGVADLREPLPLDSGCADRVLISLVLEHLPQLGPPMAELARVLRPGGQGLVVEIDPALRAAGKRAHFTDAQGAEVRPPSFAHTAEQFAAAFAAAGLRVAHTWHAEPVVAWVLRAAQ